MNKKQTVLIVDGLNTFFRNYAVNPVTDNNGIPVGGMIGSLRSIGSQIKEHKADKVYVVFDGKGGSLRRRKIYKEYKQDRKMSIRMNRVEDFDSIEEKKENMKSQLLNLYKYLEMMPIKVVIIDNVEADDVIAYINETFHTEDDTIIYSSDKDFLQLVDENTKVYSPSMKKLYDIDGVIEDYNVHPSNMVIYRILQGDKSDNINGIDGFGKKRIPQLLPFVQEDKSYSIEEVKEFVENSSNKTVLFERFIDNFDIVERNDKLMNLKLFDFSGRIKLKIQNIVEEPVKPMKKLELLIEFNRDQLSHAMNNFPHWLNEVFINVKYD